MLAPGVSPGSCRRPACICSRDGCTTTEELVGPSQSFVGLLECASEEERFFEEVDPCKSRFGPFGDGPGNR